VDDCATRQDWSDSYWHVQSDANVLNDLAFNRLMQDVVMPLRNGEVVEHGGQRFQPTDQALRVVRTPKPLSYYVEKLRRQLGETLARGVNERLMDVKAIPFLEGEDCTNELLYTDSLPPEGFGPGCRSDIRAALRLCSRVREAAKVLGVRRDRPYEIRCEADVRDLLHAVLSVFLEDVVSEEWLPKVAGRSASRADLVSKSVGLAIEVKLARAAADQTTILDELSKDMPRYAEWPHLRRLVYLIYDSHLLGNPQGLKKVFEGQNGAGGRRFEVIVILA
jgi:hypothetical protein